MNENENKSDPAPTTFRDDPPKPVVPTTPTENPDDKQASDGPAPEEKRVCV